jgi:hypothetical protein
MGAQETMADLPAMKTNPKVHGNVNTDQNTY